MGTSLLRSHDCLQGHHDALSPTPSSIRSQRNPNPSPNPYQTRRRRLHDGDRSGMVVKGPSANLVMGHVKILKRGETLSAETRGGDDEGFDLVLGSTNRLGPDPSSVPVPGFLAMRRWSWIHWLILLLDFGVYLTQVRVTGGGAAVESFLDRLIWLHSLDERMIWFVWVRANEENFGGEREKLVWIRVQLLVPWKRI